LARKTSIPQIVHVSPAWFDRSSNLGGGERYAVELAAALNRRVPTKLVTFGRERATTSVKGLPVEIYRPLFLVDGSSINPLSLSFWRELQGARIIHCHQYWTMATSLCQLYGKLRRTPVFATDLGFRGRNLARFLRGGRLSAGFLLISFFSARFYRCYAGKTRVIYGGVDTALFRPQPVPRERIVLFVGRLLQHKGIDDLIKAADATVPLRMVGRPYDAPDFSYLRMLAIGKSVTFVTDAADADLPREYARATVTVLPSVYRNAAGELQEQPELLGLTLLESMACGTPVICTNVGGMPEIVRDGSTGYVVPANAPGELGARIQGLLNDPALARAMGERGRELVLEHFTWDRVAERCLEAYRELAGFGA
jgi:glycosyltransferase involved in cell wall biosynthesis